jgi:hypothetical protein
MNIDNKAALPEQARNLTFSTVDLLLGISIALAFTNYEKCTDDKHYILFGFTIGLLTYYLHQYRIEFPKFQALLPTGFKITDLLTDCLVLFCAFRLATSYFETQLYQYTIWLSLAYCADSIWIIVKVITYNRWSLMRTCRRIYVYWATTDFLLFLIFMVAALCRMNEKFLIAIMFVLCGISAVFYYIKVPKYAKLAEEENHRNIKE